MTCSICWTISGQALLLMCPKTTLLHQIGHQYLKIHQQLLLTSYWRMPNVFFPTGVQNLQSCHSFSSCYTSNQSVDGQLSHLTCSLIYYDLPFLMLFCHNYMMFTTIKVFEVQFGFQEPQNPCLHQRLHLILEEKC
ncbi:hypothetical protein I3842_05G180100 [Carya illinoinensis]|uniref:Uncharacterized protein n=1 Tax=Carya illinoinensis TaxID=32201 RepID=A0A922JN56_CARIL|nr:hypothetical protein I3842_05G180100 [Carya illinoinensis]